MHCIEGRSGAAARSAALLSLGVLGLLAGCALPGKPAAPAPAPVTAPAPPAPSTAAAPAATAPAMPGARAPRHVQLGAPTAPRNTNELRLQMAKRLVAAHPDTSFTGRAPDRLLAIPVLEVELNADGSVRRIEVLRRPSTGDETIALAIAAVRRAAPYGDVSRLPRPWKVVETFLFDDDLRFKPRTLDIGQ